MFAIVEPDGHFQLNLDYYQAQAHLTHLFTYAAPDNHLSFSGTMRRAALIMELVDTYNIEYLPLTLGHGKKATLWHTTLPN